MSKRGSLLASAAPAVAAAASPAVGPVVVAPVSDPLAAIQPAMDAAASRAAAERVADPADVQPLPPIAPEGGIVPLAIGDPDLPTTVLPEPTLVPPEGVVPPVVTASPPLAAEPSAVDVMQAANAEDDRIVNFGGLPTGTDPAREGPHFTEAGQPMLAIQPAPLGAAAIAAEAAATPLPLDWDRDPLDVLVEVLEVTGPERGRWRGGLAFGREPRRFLRTQVTDAQLDAIQADPLLSWRFRTITAADAALLEV